MDLFFKRGTSLYGWLLSLKAEKKGWEILCDLHTTFTMLTSNCFFMNGLRQIYFTATATELSEDEKQFQ